MNPFQREFMETIREDHILPENLLRLLTCDVALRTLKATWFPASPVGQLERAPWIGGMVRQTRPGGLLS
jgi:hypothetical protein